MNTSQYFTLDRVALICIVLLFFVMSRFALTEILGIKREAEFLLIVPIFLLSLAGFVRNVKIIFNPYVFFTIFMMLTVVLVSPDKLKIALTAFSFIGIVALLSVNKEDFIFAAKTMVVFVSFFSFLAILHFTVLLFNPDLAEYGNVLIINVGSVEVKPFHPYVLLGLVTGEEHVLFGFKITRIKSFTTEPSIMVLYFVFPAALALLLKGKFWFYLSFPIALAALLSMSGMVFLSFTFAFFVFILLSNFSFKIVQYIILLSVSIVIFNLVSGNLDSFTSGLDTLKDQSSVFEKTKSFKGRAEGVANAFNRALVSPYGVENVDAPAPIFVNATLKAGWLGGIMILMIIWEFFSQSKQYLLYQKNSFHARLGVSLLFGALFVSNTMSDYGMTTYSGLIMLLLISGVLKIRNMQLMYYRKDERNI